MPCEIKDSTLLIEPLHEKIYQITRIICVFVFQPTILLSCRNIIFFFLVKETKSETINIFRKKSFLFKSFVKVEFGYVFRINLFTIAENCM